MGMGRFITPRGLYNTIKSDEFSYDNFSHILFFVKIADVVCASGWGNDIQWGQMRRVSCLYILVLFHLFYQLYIKQQFYFFPYNKTARFGKHIPG